MRELVWTTLLVGILVPVAVGAQEDGGMPDGGTYTQAQPVQNPADMGPPTGRSTDPNGNMGNEGRTGRASVPVDAAARDAPLVADGAVVPDGGTPDAPMAEPKSPPESGAEGTSGGTRSKGPGKPAAQPESSPSPSQGDQPSGGPKSE